MSENSLNIRQKFINKLISKIASLDEDIALLNKVDHKLSKQRGGAGDDVDFKSLQEKALIKRLQIDQQNEDLRNALESANALQNKIAEIKSALSNIGDEIGKINVESVDLSKIKAPEVDSHKTEMMEALSNYNLNKITEDEYLSLFAKIINEVNKGDTTIDKLKALKSELGTKSDTPWDDNFSTTYGINQRVYNKIVQSFTASAPAPAPAPAPASATRKYLF
jgi:chromosome segregation ATPase